VATSSLCLEEITYFNKDKEGKKDEVHEEENNKDNLKDREEGEKIKSSTSS
jgi:hypothetical protein